MAQQNVIAREHYTRVALETTFGVTWGRAITDRASFDVGAVYRIREDAGGRAESPLVFIAIGQTF